MVMKVLVIGSGAREHAIAWKLAQSPRVGKVYIAPGNGGTQDIGENVNIEATDVFGLVQFAEQNGIDFTVASKDDSLAAGVVDAFQARGLRIFGPTSRAAEIESSKAFAQQLMRRIGVPAAPCRIFSTPASALKYINEHGVPIVVKASGLALGKGVYVCRTIKQSETAIDNIMVKRLYGDAGSAVVIEDFIEGPEISIHAFCDWTDFALCPPAQDHKPAFEGDQGPNTGGMGTIAPVPWVSAGMMQEVKEKIVIPVLRELSYMGRPFIGCLYPGLKITPSGPKVLEINARPGDPEMPSYMRLLNTDLLDIMEACLDGKLAKCKVEWHSFFAACIVLASGGYPGGYKIGFPISGIEAAQEIPAVKVFHTGTSMVDGTLRTAGGRVLEVTATGSTLAEALKNAYDGVSYISFEGMHYRRDIGEASLRMA